jgi:hypothetical protein
MKSQKANHDNQLNRIPPTSADYSPFWLEEASQMRRTRLFEYPAFFPRAAERRGFGGRTTRPSSCLAGQRGPIFEERRDGRTPQCHNRPLVPLEVIDAKVEKSAK